MIERFGRYGVWVRTTEANPEFAAAVEEAGYPVLWVGGSPPDDLTGEESLLDATEDLIVATGIVNMWMTDPEKIAASYHRINTRFPDRFVLGLGVGHRERHGDLAVAPFGALEEFLDGLDQLGVPVQHRLLAALGPRMLALSAQRSLGAHPYMTTAAHTATAREVMGSGPLLAPEQRVVLTPDRSSGMRLASANIDRYLQITNYRNNLMAMGYEPSDFEDGGSDRILNDLAVVGDIVTVVDGLESHHQAGADHVCIQVYADTDIHRLKVFRTLAAHLTLR